MKSFNVLMITTSHQQLGDNSPDTGVWLQELAGPYFVFKDAGDRITLASPKSKALTESTQRFRTDDQARHQLAHSVALTGLEAENFDFVFITGGHGAVLDLVHNHPLTSLLEAFNRLNKPIGAIGSGVVALVSMHNSDGTPFVKDNKLTAYSNAEVELEGLTYEEPFLLKSELLNLGAFYSRSPN